jgi:hypothetical protein
MPRSTIIPTTIQVWGTLSKYAPNASPTIRMMNPIRYVAKEDIINQVLGVRC